MQLKNISKIKILSKLKFDRANIFKLLFIGTGRSIFTMFVWELVEEALEYAIAYFVSSVVTLLIAKVLTTLTIITITQAIKVALKRFFMPIILKLTKKDGGDKVNMIKKIFQALNANKCTVVGIISALAVALSGGGLINPEVFLPEWNVSTEVVYYEQGEIISDAICYEEGEVIAEAIEEVVAEEVVYEEDGVTVKYNVGDIITPAVDAVIATGTEIKVEAVIANGSEIKEAVPANNITPIIYYVGLGILIILASFFPEKVQAYATRVAEATVAKKEAADIKAAEALVKAEKKQAEKDLKEAAKVKAAEEKAAAQAIADAEKQKAKEEHDKKIAELVAKMKADEQNKKA